MNRLVSMMRTGKHNMNMPQMVRLCMKWNNILRNKSLAAALFSESR